MRKILKKVICVGVMLIVVLNVLCACNDDNFRNERNGEPEAGQFYTLQKAYDNGWLSKGDLRNIAYHKTGDAQKKGFTPTPKNPAELSSETILAIKECGARDLREAGFVEAVADDITVDAYYGTYDGLIAIMKSVRYADYPDVVMEVEIGGLVFINPDRISIWKPNN